MKQLTPMDAHFFYFDAPHQPMVVGSLWICDQRSAPNGLVRHKDIIRFINSRLHNTSLFRRRLQHAPFRLDDPYWVEDKSFDLEYHIRHVGLPQPGDWRQLCIFAARAMSRTLDMERAPWEIIVIEGLDNVEGVPAGSFALLLRFHHSYIDGMAGIQVNSMLMTDQPEFEEANQHPLSNERLPSRTQLWTRTIPRLAAQPLRSMRASLRVAHRGLQLFSQRHADAIPAHDGVPGSIFNVQVSPHRTFGALIWKIGELKQVRRCVQGATLNDVIVAIIGGALRRYLERRDVLPHGQSLVSLCPVAIATEQGNRNQGNFISAMLIGVGTDIDDAQERLEIVHERTQSGTHLAREQINDLMLSVGDMLPAPVRMLGGWLSKQLRYVGNRHLCNMVITNVPGPAGNERKYFAGAEIQALYPIIPVMDDIGICHGLTSLYDQMMLGVNCDREVMPDIDVYMDCLRQSTDEYLALAQQNAARVAPAAQAPGEPQPARRRKAADAAATDPS